MSARITATALAEQTATIVDTVDQKFVSRIGGTNDPELAAVMIFDLLELIHKMSFFTATVRSALEGLETLRHNPSNDELWPSLPSREDEFQGDGGSFADSSGKHRSSAR